MARNAGNRGSERSPWSDQVSAQIRAERAAAGLTQNEMEERSGIPHSTYVRIETGKRVPDTTQLARICGALGMPQSVFFARVEERVQAAGGDDPATYNRS